MACGLWFMSERLRFRVSRFQGVRKGSDINCFLFPGSGAFFSFCHTAVFEGFVSGPESGPGFFIVKVNVMTTNQVVHFSLDSGRCECWTRAGTRLASETTPAPPLISHGKCV